MVKKQSISVALWVRITLSCLFLYVLFQGPQAVSAETVVSSNTNMSAMATLGSAQVVTTEAQIATLLALLNQLMALYEQILASNGQAVAVPIMRPEPVSPEPVKPIDDSREVVAVPGVNRFSCDRTGTKLGEGQLACYGVWDFGSAFGNDENMCSASNWSTPQRGCTVKTQMCKSGLAEASRVIDTYAPWHNGEARLASEADIREISQNLGASTAAVKKELIRVWEYRCTGVSDSVEDDETVGETVSSVWSHPQSAADILVVGVYEGSYPAGVRHSSGYHPEGSVTVDVASVSSENTLLMLNAYEPVHWTITGSAKDYIKGVVVTGYHDQRVSGLASDIEVVEQTQQNGSSDYFIVYDEESDEFSDLQNYVRSKTGLKPYLFFGEYAAERVVVGVKG